jgi:hypothetical protein
MRYGVEVKDPKPFKLVTNELLGTNPKAIKSVLDKLFDGSCKKKACLNSGMGKPWKELLFI